MSQDTPSPQARSEYEAFLAERDEILRHKWLESEKAGRDIGFEQALIDWVRNHREAWRRERKDTQQKQGGAG